MIGPLIPAHFHRRTDEHRLPVYRFAQLAMDFTLPEFMRNNAGAVPSNGDTIKLIGDKSGNSAENCLVLNGVAGNYASTPDSVPLSITGDITVDFYGVLNDWFTTSVQTLISKRSSTAGQYSWQFSTFDTGAARQLLFAYTVDGTTQVQDILSGLADLSNFTPKWFRAARNATTGIVTYYSSDDGANFTSLGTGIGSSAGSIFDSTAPLEVGSNRSGTGNLMTGTVSRCRVYSGLPGALTLAFDANFTTAAKLATSFTESSSNAATVTINATGDLGARISGERDLYQFTSTKQPVLLQYSGTNYGYLNGMSGNYFSAPDSAAVDITGDIDIRLRMSLDDWTPASAVNLLAKWASAGQYSYRFRLNTSGFPQILFSLDGTATVTVDATAVVSFSDYSTGWVRVTRASASGQVIFYTSTDGASWTQLGSTVSSTSGAIFDGTSVVEIGSALGGSTGVITGRVYRAQIYNGINGTLVFDFDPSRYTSGTTFTEGSSNAATVTLNGGATIVTRTSLYFDGTDDYMKAASFSLSQPETVYFAGSQVSWTLNDTLFDGNASASLKAVQSSTTPNFRLDAGTAGFTENGSFPVGASRVLSAVFNGASSSSRVNRGALVTGNPGTTAASGFTLASNGSGASGWSNITASEVIIYAAAHDEIAQQRMARWAIRKHRIAA